MSSRPSVASGGICCTGSPFIEKRGMEKRSCYRKRIRYFFHSSFLYLNAGTSRTLFCHLERQPVVLSRVEGPVYPCHPSCHLERQPRGLLTEADSSTPGLGPTLGMTEKAKTVEKRNSFPGFSFFECPSFALFLFLSCGDAGVSSAFGLVVLVWFVFLFIFAYE